MHVVDLDVRFQKPEVFEPTSAEYAYLPNSTLDVIFVCPTPARAPILYGVDGDKLTLQLPVGLGAHTEVFQRQ